MPAAWATLTRLARSRHTRTRASTRGVMSALRKLRQLKLNAEAAAAATTPTSAPEEDRRDTVEKPKANAFDMLMQEEDEEEEQEQEQPEEVITPPVESPSAPAAVESPAAESTSETAAAPIAAQPKKAKAKKPAASKPKKASSSKAAAVVDQEAWELEFAVDSQAASSSSSAASAQTSSTTPTVGLWDMLRTESRLLDPQSEIRAVFGGRMDRAAAAEEAAQNTNGGQNHGGFRRGGALSRRMAGGGISARAATTSRRLLIRPNPNWPRTEERGLIKMEFIARVQRPTPPKTKKAAGMHGNIHSIDSAPTAASASGEEDSSSSEAAEYAASVTRFDRQQLAALTPGSRFYSFVHTSEFDRIQQEYLSTVASHDVHILSYFARSHPFHPEAALTMSDIFSAQSEHATAHEFVQRVLHVYENAFTNEFLSALNTGTARLDVDRSESLPFLTALAKHAQTLGKKGCPRTALEVTKLLLSLSPLSDPLGALFAIDYYALRSKQFEFLLHLPAALDRAVMAAYDIGQHPWAAKRDQSASAAAPTSATNVRSVTSASSSSSSSATSGWTQPQPRAPCTYLPNMMFSRALAAWHIENDTAAAATDKSKKKATTSASAASAAAAAAAASAASAAAAAAAASAVFTGIVQPASLPVSASGHSMLDEADAAYLASSTDPAVTSSSYLLQQAMLTWPSVLKPLLEAAGAESAVNRSGGPWATALSALNGLYAGSFLASATGSAAASSTPYLAKLELIYAERTATLWKSDKVQSWLLANARALAEAIEAKRYSPEVVSRFASARSQYLLSLPFPAAVRSMQKSAYSDHVAQLPPELLMAQNQAQFDLAGDRARQQAAQMADAGMQPLDLDQHPMRVFLQSLLPWFVAPGGGEQQGEGGDAAAADLPRNMEEAVARMQQMPPEQREAMLRDLMGRAAAAEQQELQAALGMEQAELDEEDAVLEAALQEEIAAGGGADAEHDDDQINYADYQFDDDEDAQQ